MDRRFRYCRCRDRSSGNIDLMAKGNPNPSTPRFSATYQPSPEKLKERGSIAAMLRYAMHDTELRSPGGNGKVKITNAERIARTWLKLAAAGNMQAIEKAADRIDGKVVDKQALTDAAGDDVQLDDRAFAVWLAAKLAKPKA